MSEQKSNTRGESSSVNKADSTRYGFDPIPATSKVDGAFAGNEPTGRTAVEVMDQYTELNMHEDADSNEGIEAEMENLSELPDPQKEEK